MSEHQEVASFLARWGGRVRHDLSGSDSESLPLADLLALADPDDRARWERLSFRYADPLGAPWLREAIARRHVSVDADGVVCCAGAQEATSCVARAILGPADHAIVVVPIYRPSEDAVAGLCAATGVPLEGPAWQLDVDRVASEVRPNTKLVLTNFPNSPTGVVLEPQRLAALVSLCRRHGLWLVTDEIYRQTAEPADVDATPMIADLYERGVSINGLSKGFGLPGLRVGWAACRDRGLRDRVVEAKGRVSNCITTASEVLAHVALRSEADITSRARSIGAENRRRLRGFLGRCTQAFAHDAVPNCAFAFPRYLGPGQATELAERLARDAGVLVMPSTLWASSLGAVARDHVRIGLGHIDDSDGIRELERSLRALSGRRMANKPAPSTTMAATGPGAG